MVVADAVAEDCFAVVLGGVAFVFVPSIFRVLLGDAHHVFVTMCLGKDRCCSYRHIFAVAFDHGGVVDSRIGTEFIAVD